MTDTGAPFRFSELDRLTDGTLELRVAERVPADPSKGHVPSYTFQITRSGEDVVIGELRLRVGHVPSLEVSGHIGYEIFGEFRGHAYAARACRLVAPIARAHGLEELVITCDPGNVPSRRTCERIGAVLQGIFDVPTDHDLYRQGHRRYCQYRWRIPPDGGAI